MSIRGEQITSHGQTNLCSAPSGLMLRFCRDFSRAFSPGWYVSALQALFESAIPSPEGAQHTSLG